MMKTLCGAAALCLAMAASSVVPANAMDPMMCDDATMAKMQTEMDAVTDPAMKRNGRGPIRPADHCGAWYYSCGC